MYDHTFHKQAQISRSDIRPNIKWAVSLVILHMITSIFLLALCGYIWVNILTLSPRGDRRKTIDSLISFVQCILYNIMSISNYILEVTIFLEFYIQQHRDLHNKERYYYLLSMYLMMTSFVQVLSRDNNIKLK